jgi:predicted SprT family Zn-dependent metalloprotease
MNRRLSAIAAFKMIVLFRTVGNHSVTFRNMKKSVAQVSYRSAEQSDRSIVRDRRYQYTLLFY